MDSSSLVVIEYPRRSMDCLVPGTQSTGFDTPERAKEIRITGNKRKYDEFLNDTSYGTSPAQYESKAGECAIDGENDGEENEKKTDGEEDTTSADSLTKTAREKRLKPVPRSAPRDIETMGRFSFHRGVRIRDYKVLRAVAGAFRVPENLHRQCRDGFDDNELSPSKSDYGRNRAKPLEFQRPSQE